MTGTARRLLRAEWTKIRTLPTTGWLLAAAVALTVAVGAAAASALRCPAGACTGDPTMTALTGVQVGQLVVVVLAALAVGGEYGSGTIRATLAAAPRRTAVLAAKAAVLGALVLVTGLAGVAGSLLAGRAVLPHHTGPATPVLLRAAGGSVLYLVLVALLTLGVAFAVRNSAATIGAVLALLYLGPIVAGVVTDEHWRRHLHQVAPMSAGLSVQSTVAVHDLPLTPWAGLGVLAAWTTAALLTGGTLLHVRDT